MKLLFSLALALVPATFAQVQVGDTICVEGYVMDHYCIDNVVLLDNPGKETLKYPE